MSFDDALANEAAQPPRIQAWKDVPVLQTNVRATIGEPTEVVWSEAISEMKFVREVFQKNFGTLRPSIGQLSDLFFGPESKIFGVFKDNLQWSIEDFKSFIKTFLVLSTYKLSPVTNMYCAQSYIETITLRAREEYVTCWREISRCSLQSNHLARSHIAGQTFWAAIGNALNTDLRTKILPSFLADANIESFRTIFDDDKMRGLQHP
eukprot:scaffold120168_cov94-Attheya_sp.AAC.1